jgi:hypothetical protein
VLAESSIWRLAQGKRSMESFSFQMQMPSSVSMSAMNTIPEAVPASINLSGAVTSRHAVITGPNSSG